MPATDAFDKQDADYRETVLPAAVKARVAIEAGIADYWFKYVGLDGVIVGMHSFGESALQTNCLLSLVLLLKMWLHRQKLYLNNQ